MAEPAQIAHLLKRTSFLVTPDRVDQFASGSWEDALSILVDGASPPAIGNLFFRNVYQETEDRDYIDLFNYELNRLVQPASGLGDRMLWFWHGMLTTGLSKIELPALAFRQHQLIARNALGNFRKLMKDLTIDAGMLLYLDGNGSTADAPNENYGREVMELFTLGRGLYQQSDVRAAAHGLAGWYVDGYPEHEGQHFDPANIVSLFDSGSAYVGEINYVGSTIHLDGSNTQYEKIIDTVVELQLKPGNFPSAEFIVRKLYEYFVHPGPDEATVARLAAVFRYNDYEIMPLLAALFRTRDFNTVNARQARAEFPLELFLRILTAFRARFEDFDALSYVYATGQVPFDPPNVAGWQVGNRWVSASHTLARARLGDVSFDLPPRNGAVLAIMQADDPVAETLRQMSLYDVSRETVKALSTLKSIRSRQQRARAMLTAATLSPEFALG